MLIADILTSGSDFNLAELEAQLVQMERAAGLNLTRGPNVPLGSTVDLTVAGTVDYRVLQMTAGAVTITSFGAVQSGAWFLIRCNGATTVVHDGVNISTADGVNITAAGDDLLFVWGAGTIWRVWLIARRREVDVFNRSINAAWQVVSSATLGAPVSSYTLTLPATYGEFELVIADLLPSTSAALLVMQISLDGTTFLNGGSEYLNRLSCFDATAGATLVAAAASRMQLTRDLATTQGALCRFTMRPGAATTRFSLTGEAVHEHATGSLNWGGCRVASRASTAGRAAAIRLFPSAGNIDAGTRIQLNGLLRP